MSVELGCPTNRVAGVEDDEHVVMAFAGQRAGLTGIEIGPQLVARRIVIARRQGGGARELQHIHIGVVRQRVVGER